MSSQASWGGWGGPLRPAPTLSSAAAWGLRPGAGLQPWPTLASCAVLVQWLPPDQLSLSTEAAAFEEEN